MPPSNPFDFSDFGQSSAAPPSGGFGAPMAPPVGPQSSGFNPQSSGFNPPPTATRPGGGGFDPFGAGGDVIAPGGSPFGGSEGTPMIGDLTVAGPPTKLMFGALGVAILGVILGLVAIPLDNSVVLALLGWLLAGPGAIGMLAWFSAADTKRRMNSVYSAPAWLSNGYWAVLAVSAMGIALGAWQIARWAGRL